MISIKTSIAPAHQTPRGRSTIAAVMSYCGKPFAVLEDGHWRTRFGWQNLKIFKYPNLGQRIAGACDVPDLFLFPVTYPDVKTVTFHAALEAPWEQGSLWLMAALSRLGLIKDWSKFAPLFQSISKPFIRLGSDRGAMSVCIEGLDHSNRELTIVWNLRAGSNHGPEIPCTPTLVLVRKLLSHQLSIRGALACTSLFSLDDFAKELEGFDISWSHKYA